MVREGLKKISKMIKKFLLNEGANNIFYKSYINGVIYKNNNNISFLKWSTPIAEEDLTANGKKKRGDILIKNIIEIMKEYNIDTLEISSEDIHYGQHKITVSSVVKISEVV